MDIANIIKELGVLYHGIGAENVKLSMFLLFLSFVVWKLNAPITTIMQHTTVIIDKIIAFIQEQLQKKFEQKEKLVDTLERNSLSLDEAMKLISSYKNRCNIHKPPLHQKVNELNLSEEEKKQLHDLIDMTL